LTDSTAVCVDHFVKAMDELVHAKGFRDFRAVDVGSGPAVAQVRELARSLNLSDFVVFTGYLSGEALLSHISAFDIGVIPDPYNEANDVMSMNKGFEYCALGIRRELSAQGDEAAPWWGRRLCPDARSGRARQGVSEPDAGRAVASELLSGG
jgi:hypothetical protein